MHKKCWRDSLCKIKRKMKCILRQKTHFATIMDFFKALNLYKLLKQWGKLTSLAQKQTFWHICVKHFLRKNRKNVQVVLGFHFLSFGAMSFLRGKAQFLPWFSTNRHTIISDWRIRKGRVLWRKVKVRKLPFLNTIHKCALSEIKFWKTQEIYENSIYHHPTSVFLNMNLHTVNEKIKLHLKRVQPPK